MLVLQRYTGEEIYLELENGERIEVILVEIRGPFRARLGFKAPDSVKIIRKELAKVQP